LHKVSLVVFQLSVLLYYKHNILNYSKLSHICINIASFYIYKIYLILIITQNFVENEKNNLTRYQKTNVTKQIGITNLIEVCISTSNYYNLQ